MIEVASAIHRQNREGQVTPEDRERALAQLREDIEAFILVELGSDEEMSALEHLARHPLRAGDAVQLASATVARSQVPELVRFLCFDARLTAAAQAEGFVVGLLPEEADPATP